MGGKKGGGGSIDVDVDADANSSMVLDIVGLDDVDITTTTTSTNRLEVPDPIRTRMEMAVTEPIDTRLTLSVPDVVRTDQHQRSEFAITEPIVTQTSADLDVDVKPVVVDLCLTLGIKDLPRFCISRPYDRHVGLSLFGREVIGVDWRGSSHFIVDDVRPRAFVAGATQSTVSRRGPQRHDHAGDEGGSGRDEGRGGRPPRPGVRFVID